MTFETRTFYKICGKEFPDLKIAKEFLEEEIVLAQSAMNIERNYLASKFDLYKKYKDNKDYPRPGYIVNINNTQIIVTNRNKSACRQLIGEVLLKEYKSEIANYKQKKDYYYKIVSELRDLKKFQSNKVNNE